ncbi:MAG: hypothetical protein KDA99_19880, partial [Planctomycetales bacterium]|nr:hypothetical protein [Planctomycetales bacterium]
LLPLDQLDAKFTRGLVVRVSEAEHGERGLEQLYEIVRGYPGSGEFQLVLQLADGSRVVMTSGKVRIDVNAEVRQRIDDLLGPGNLKILTATPNGKDNGRRRSA